MRKIIVGTRGSKLALIQARTVIRVLQEELPQQCFELKTIKTTGDVITDIPLEKLGDKGIFIKELESALLDGEIDLAVHSMKDMPTTLPPGLCFGAIMTRENPIDVVIGSDNYQSLAALHDGARIGSSSLRRRAQLLHHYPHLNILSIRGNLDTRLRKLKEGQFEAIVLAYAGVKRMGWIDLISEEIDPSICLPAVGQGSIAVEIREDDNEVASLVKYLNCTRSASAITAERAFLRKLEGGCQVPVGALACVSGERLQLEGMVASLSGELIFREKVEGLPAEAEFLGSTLADMLLGQGCGSILEQIRREC